LSKAEVIQFRELIVNNLALDKFTNNNVYTSHGTFVRFAIKSKNSEFSMIQNHLHSYSAFSEELNKFIAFCGTLNKEVIGILENDK
jgi:hypothetical protein